MSEAYTPDNVLDRVTDRRVIERHERRTAERERTLLEARLGLDGGTVVSVGCGWHPGRHLFPAPAWRMIASDLDQERCDWAVARGEADQSLPAPADDLPLPDRSVDVVLQRLVLHHVAYRGSVVAAVAEGARVLKTGGVLVAVEPSRRHPVGAALALANRLGLGVRVHGTPDDIPLPPRRLVRAATSAGLQPELHGVTYSWRRLPGALQGLLERVDPYGSNPAAAPFAHTVMLIARKPAA